MANAYVIAKPWPLATAPQVSVQPMQKFATSVLPKITPVPEGATLEEKYNTLLADYKELKVHSESLETRKKLMTSEMHKRFLEIQTANNQIKDQHEEINHALFAIQMFLKLGA